MTATPVGITVSIDRRVAPHVAEVKYALRTLLHSAGYAPRFSWADDAESATIHYGPARDSSNSISIPLSGHDFLQVAHHSPSGASQWRQLPFLLFPDLAFDAAAPPLTWPTDIIFSTFWLLSGADEPAWPRDQRGNLLPHNTVLAREGLFPQAPISQWASRLRDQLTDLGFPPLLPKWAQGDTQSAFCFTHDVDYPEIIRPIESLRVVAQRRPHALRNAARILRGTSHYWTFLEWVDFERQFGARPTFYFMARAGSLLKYARGVPDDFYDVRSPRFAELFAQLRDAGCEIGLHASYLAYQSAETIRIEAERIANCAGAPVLGNRHHYWHLDPDDPNETLRRHEIAGLRYDSSLGLEFFPGFRRGICHPYRPYHLGERRELATVQLPPAWMDDHFDRRLASNGITDPNATALEILNLTKRVRGISVVNYHSRGMNGELCPAYGPWITRFAEQHFDRTLAFRTGQELLADFIEHERELQQYASDDTRAEDITLAPHPIKLVVEPAQPRDLPEIAALHHALFSDPDFNGFSLATLGVEFLETVLYQLGRDNPQLRVLVARAEGRVVGFSVHTTDRNGIGRHVIRKHPLRLIAASVKAILGNPKRLRGLLANVRYLGDKPPARIAEADACWVVFGAHPDARGRLFYQRSGQRVATALADATDADLRALGCHAWVGAVRPENAAFNAFLRTRNAEEIGNAEAQGLAMRYYIKRLTDITQTSQ